MDVFEKYKEYYPDGVVRPQPTDFVLSYFERVQNGFFLDVGAHDGITWSNSLALDECLGWRGICFEPNPTVFPKLVKNRPNVTCLNIGVTDNNESSVFLLVSGYAEMLSGFKNSCDPQHLSRIHKDMSTHGGKLQEININGQTLDDTISQYSINKIDYLSVDVEGGEMNVLLGLGIKYNRPTLISIEDNGYTTEPHDFLISSSYKFLRRVCGDCFYERV